MRTAESLQEPTIVEQLSHEIDEAVAAGKNGSVYRPSDILRVLEIVGEDNKEMVPASVFVHAVRDIVARAESSGSIVVPLTNDEASTLIYLASQPALGSNCIS